MYWAWGLGFKAYVLDERKTQRYALHSSAIPPRLLKLNPKLLALNPKSLNPKPLALNPKHQTLTSLSSVKVDAALKASSRHESQSQVVCLFLRFFCVGVPT